MQSSFRYTGPSVPHGAGPAFIPPVSGPIPGSMPNTAPGGASMSAAGAPGLAAGMGTFPSSLPSQINPVYPHSVPIPSLAPNMQQLGGSTTGPASGPIPSLFSSSSMVPPSSTTGGSGPYSSGASSMGAAGSSSHMSQQQAQAGQLQQGGTAGGGTSGTPAVIGAPESAAVEAQRLTNALAAMTAAEAAALEASGLPISSISLFDQAVIKLLGGAALHTMPGSIPLHVLQGLQQQKEREEARKAQLGSSGHYPYAAAGGEGLQQYCSSWEELVERGYAASFLTSRNTGKPVHVQKMVATGSWDAAPPGMALPTASSSSSSSSGGQGSSSSSSSSLANEHEGRYDFESGTVIMPAHAAAALASSSSSSKSGGSAAAAGADSSKAGSSSKGAKQGGGKMNRPGGSGGAAGSGLGAGSVAGGSGGGQGDFSAAAEAATLSSLVLECMSSEGSVRVDWSEVGDRLYAIGFTFRSEQVLQRRWVQGIMQDLVITALQGHAAAAAAAAAAGGGAAAGASASSMVASQESPSYHQVARAVTLAQCSPPLPPLTGTGRSAIPAGTVLMLPATEADMLLHVLSAFCDSAVWRAQLGGFHAAASTIAAAAAAPPTVGATDEESSAMQEEKEVSAAEATAPAQPQESEGAAVEAQEAVLAAAPLSSSSELSSSADSTFPCSFIPLTQTQWLLLGQYLQRMRFWSLPAEAALPVCVQLLQQRGVVSTEELRFAVAYSKDGWQLPTSLNASASMVAGAGAVGAGHAAGGDKGQKRMRTLAGTAVSSGAAASGPAGSFSQQYYY